MPTTDETVTSAPVDGPFDRILVPLDTGQGSRRAYHHAKAMGDKLGCPLTILTAVEDAEQQGALDGALDAYLNELQAVDDKTDTVVAEGDAAQAIVETSATFERPLIAMATRNARPLGEALFGSVTSRVLREAGHPMLLVGPYCGPEGSSASMNAPKTMLVCLDRSRVSDSILPLAREVATHLDLSVLLMHVIYPTAPPTTRDAQLTPEDREMYGVLSSTAAAWQHEGIDATWEVAQGTWPPDTIVGTSVRRSFDLIAMATHGRSALARLLTGSTIARVLEQTPVPILTHRPSQLLH